MRVSNGDKRGECLERLARNVHGVRSRGPVVLARLRKASELQHILYLLVNRVHQKTFFHHFVQ
jgi:hypothetical protein